MTGMRDSEFDKLTNEDRAIQAQNIGLSGEPPKYLAGWFSIARLSCIERLVQFSLRRLEGPWPTVPFP